MISVGAKDPTTAQVANELRVLQQAFEALRPGGLLFLYGEPQVLALWGEQLLTEPALTSQLQFKYWIAIELAAVMREEFLVSAHRGLLMFLRLNPRRKTPPPFQLHVGALRIPHRHCTACGQNLKDWGGKKHLMNPAGAAPSDVWRDLPRRELRDEIIPPDVFERVAKLAGTTTDKIPHFEIKPPKSNSTAEIISGHAHVKSKSTDDFARLAQVELDHVYAGDCVSFLHRVEVLHPAGFFDLAFADPPYNLAKNYHQWDDAMADQHYLDWCNAWLDAMAATLKPGGSLFVLNLPKWTIHHAAFLSRRLDFRHWIAWDALSDPRGKLMPAHYGLLWFTKPGGKAVCNYASLGAKPRDGFVTPPDSPQYCLRPRCVHDRKARGNDAKVELTDVWFDIHRIKHKRDRDAHPCQLPEKLMERIIKLASRPGDVVFDPFCGAGTTAMAAMKLDRRFVVTDVDAKYVRITREKIAAMRQHADMFGEFVVPRESTTRKRSDLTKREIERYLQELARTLQRVPTEADVLADRPGLLDEIDHLYPYRSAAFKRAKIGL